MCKHTYIKILILLSLTASLHCLKFPKKLPVVKVNTTPNIVITKKLQFIDNPQNTDMPIFLNVLSRIVNYCKNNRQEIDLNFAFGLFLIKVNLKSAIRNSNLDRRHVHFYQIRTIIKENNELLAYFEKKMNNDTSQESLINKKIYSVFVSESNWARSLKPLKVHIESKINLKTATKMYPKKKDYLRKFKDYTILTPTPKQSDKCIASIVKNEMNNSQNELSCILEKPCYSILKSGSDIGYSLTHRLLWFISAHYGRGCVIFDRATDDDMMLNFCTRAFAEANYIAKIGFPEVDLLLEQISFCVLEGHAEFLKRDWLMRAVLYQSRLGCFGFRTAKLFGSGSPDWMISRNGPGLFELEKDNCDGHTTATAAAAFASAIRYLVNAYKY